MPPLTVCARRETTRKLAAAGGALAVLLALAGCATAGPNHVYVATAASAGITDLGPNPGQLAALLTADERVVGLAYDFNTDHLFLRVAPTQVIRVVERPSGKVLREMPLLPELQTDQPADLAIRSADRHLFALHPDGRSVIELTLFGKPLRRIELRGLAGAASGLAYDQKKQRLLILSNGNPAQVGVVDAEGNVTYYVTFHTAVNPVSLGYDSDRDHAFVPLDDGTSIGEFDATGQLVARHAVGAPVTAIDAGPRSFVRVF